MIFSKDKRKVSDEELLFMDEVDAALHRKPVIGAKALTLGTAVAFLVFLIWAAWGDVDEVTRGQGQVVSSQSTQIIENLEGGILEELLVDEGQIVEKGQVLAQISNATAESVYRDTIQKSYELEAMILRLEAELDGTELKFNRMLQDNAAQVVEDQLRLYTIRMQQGQAEINILQSQYSQKMNQVEEAKSRKTQLEENLRLSKEQAGIAMSLAAKGLYSRVDALGMQQKVSSLEGELQALSSSIPKAQGEAEEVQQKVILHSSETKNKVAEELNKRRAELTSLRETLGAGVDRVDRTEVRSPVRGAVKQIMLATVGGVVKPGEPIMALVPLDEAMLVEVRIRPADIAFIHDGQKALVKITAYDYSIYGGLEGVVEQISADTIEDRRGEFFYLIKLRTAKTSLNYKGKTLPIIPGMVASVDILTGKKSILDFLLKPVLKAKQNALTER